MPVADNLALSPYTGWTRRHHLKACATVIAGLARRLDPGTGILSLPVNDAEPAANALVGRKFAGARYHKNFTRDEAWERCLIAVGFYLAAGGGTSVPGYDGDIAAVFRRRIVNGVDPRHPDRFGTIPDYDTCGSWISLACLCAPRFFIDPLSGAERRRLLGWLAGTLTRKSYHNNHYLFHLQAVPLLERYGFPYDRRLAKDLLERCLKMYAGDGWYRDGSNNACDYYNAWGFHFYLLNLIYFDEGFRRAHGGAIRRAARRFLRDYVYFFDENGAHVPFGRSLAYRFAAVSPIGFALLNEGAWPYAAGLARRIVSGNIRYFLRRRCLNAEGFLDAGFHEANYCFTEDYMSAGSGYWAATGFSHLLLPAAHPFWTQKEQALPRLSSKPLPVPAFIVSRKKDGSCRLSAVGSPCPVTGRWQTQVKYGGHTYDSRIGFAASGEGRPPSLANRSAVSFDGGRTWHERFRPRPGRIRKDRGVSFYKTPHGDVVTETILLERGEILIIRHKGGRRRFRLRVGGYGIQVPHGEKVRVQKGKDRIILRSGTMATIMAVLACEGKGSLEAVALRPSKGFAHAHLFGGKAAFPLYACAQMPSAGRVVLYVDAVADPAAAFDVPAPAAASRPKKSRPTPSVARKFSHKAVSVPLPSARIFVAPAVGRDYNISVALKPGAVRPAQSR
ncbi:MAG: DUF2264 domain-containing protein [Deltaproteobacteria bacterium]